MEAFLLNPTSAAQNPVSPQGGTAIQGENNGDFSPVMVEAVTSLENGNNQQGRQPTGGGADPSTDQSADQVITDVVNPVDPLQSKAAQGSSPLNESAIRSTKDLLMASASPTTLTNTPLLAQEFTVETSTEDKTVELFIRQSLTPVNQSVAENKLTSTAKAESLLLQQIQQILDQGKNNGSITITGSTSSNSSDPNIIEKLQNLSAPLLADSPKGIVQLQQVGAGITAPNGNTALPSLNNNTAITTPDTNATINVAVTGTIDSNKIGIALIAGSDDTTFVAQKSAKLEGSQQDVTEQYFNAKLGDSKTNTGSSFQEGTQNQKGTEQQSKNELQAATGQTNGTSISDIKPVESSFGQLLSTSSETSTQATPIEGKLAPGANLHVPGREVVNTLIQRFNVNPRLQTSKLTMHLHPAELGALKIDILVEGDSIKANIVAQSQQVLETLEKNMPRLREALQEQGFTVDAFEITMDGDGGKQKELFQEHFNSQQQEFASNKSSSQNNESFDSLFDTENEGEESDRDQSGVNLTV